MFVEIQRTMMNFLKNKNIIQEMGLLLVLYKKKLTNLKFLLLTSQDQT